MSRGETQRSGERWWATSPWEPSGQGVWELEFRATHKAKAQGTESLQGDSVSCGWEALWLSEVLGDRDERLVWALLPRRRVVRRQVSELGESWTKG